MNEDQQIEEEEKDEFVLQVNLQRGQPPQLLNSMPASHEKQFGSSRPYTQGDFNPPDLESLASKKRWRHEANLDAAGNQMVMLNDNGEPVAPVGV